MSLILGDKLPDRAIGYLQVGRLVILATVDERGMPNTSPISWITALDCYTLRLAVSTEVQTYYNILRNENVILTMSSALRVKITHTVSLRVPKQGSSSSGQSGLRISRRAMPMDNRFIFLYHS